MLPFGLVREIDAHESGVALRSLGLVDRNDRLTELIARKVIEIGATGVSDAGTTSREALSKSDARLELA